MSSSRPKAQDSSRFAARPSRPGTSPLNSAGPKTPRTPSTSFHSRHTSADEGGEQAKRLVEQFFRVDGKSRPSGLVDKGGYLFGSALRPDTPASDPSAEPEGPPGLAKSHVFMAALDDRAGSWGSAFPGDLADDMVNIDTDSRTPPLEKVEQQLAAVADTLQQASRHGETFSGTRQQLRDVEAHLARMRENVERVAAELRHSSRVAQKHYRGELQRSSDKVAALRELLDTVGERVARARARVNASKDVLARDVAQKIEVLDYVRGEFAEYDRVQRRRRLRQISVALAVAVVMASLYMGLST